MLNFYMFWSSFLDFSFVSLSMYEYYTVLITYNFQFVLISYRVSPRVYLPFLMFIFTHEITINLSRSRKKWYFYLDHIKFIYKLREYCCFYDTEFFCPRTRNVFFVSFRSVSFLAPSLSVTYFLLSIFLKIFC